MARRFLKRWAIWNQVQGAQEAALGDFDVDAVGRVRFK